MDLYQKAELLGLQTTFVDGQGRPRVTDGAALQIILNSLPATPPERWLKSAVVVRAGTPTHAEFGRAATFPVDWVIQDGRKTLAKGRAESQNFNWPGDLPVGTYQIKLGGKSRTKQVLPFIVAPGECFGGTFDRSWLLAVQLYGVRSKRNWGIGDFSDVEELLQLASALGADGLGLNPMHALFDDRPADCSPYSPNSRLFLNGLYIDVEKLPEFSPGDFADSQNARTRLQSNDIIDYVAVADLKWSALRIAFEAFNARQDADRKAEFEKFRKERGSLLLRFACFEVLRHRFGTPWWDWPEDWHKPDDTRCADLRNGDEAEEIAFVEFVQWCADQQISSCQQKATQLGMKLGLYLDVAVGAQSDGFDSWNEQIAISRQLGIGAPPDPLNTAGQSWGLAGFNAVGLEAQSFEPFRQMLKASMRHAGAIRLDHVLGLNRLYVIPHGFAPENGVYVQMPFEALLAVTAQESVANQCVVIGEDLGTVPEGFRDKIASWGVWSYLVMMFERDDSGKFRGVDHYLSNALVTFNTHDLATYAGWRDFADLNLKRSLGIDPGESDDARWHALHMLSDALHQQGIVTHDFYAIIDFLSRTKSRLLAIQLEDLLGVVDQPNLPGTVNEHPNWRRRLPVAVDQIADSINLDALRKALEQRVTKS